MHARRGFTLIEMLVTLSVLAILLTLATPSLSAWFARARLAGATGSVTDTLRFARKQAITRQQPVWLQTRSGDDWSLIVSQNRGESCEQALACIRAADYRGVSLETQGLPAQIRFSPLKGLPQNAAGVALGEASWVLTQQHCSDSTIKLLPTGFIHASKGNCP
ncbi:prepilin-type N-terminal cleavage/methylation domain-containing protein [Aquitalea sp. S1-19]|nr:prepilin-type N-terminal cleavage/methylation domain-containing protein [Aquitalea sp. S1-19]